MPPAPTAARPPETLIPAVEACGPLTCGARGGGRPWCSAPVSSVPEETDACCWTPAGRPAARGLCAPRASPPIPALFSPQRLQSGGAGGRAGCPAGSEAGASAPVFAVFLQGPSQQVKTSVAVCPWRAARQEERRRFSERALMFKWLLGLLLATRAHWLCPVCPGAARPSAALLCVCHLRGAALSPRCCPRGLSR